MPSDRAGAPDAILRHSADAVFNRLGTGGVVVNLKTNRIFELNATGMRAWELLEAGCTRAQLEEQLDAEFDAAPGRVRAELEQLITDLAREGLVDADPRG